MQDTVPCQGFFDRKFEILYDDGNAGATTAQKLWTDKCQKNQMEQLVPLMTKKL